MKKDRYIISITFFLDSKYAQARVSSYKDISNYVWDTTRPEYFDDTDTGRVLVMPLICLETKDFPQDLVQQLSIEVYSSIRGDFGTMGGLWLRRKELLQSKLISMICRSIPGFNVSRLIKL